MKWFYKDIGLNRKQAEEKILSLNFKPAKNRGWVKMKYVAGINYSHLSEKLLDETMPSEEDMEKLSDKFKV